MYDMYGHAGYAHNFFFGDFFMIVFWIVVVCVIMNLIRRGGRGGMMGYHHHWRQGGRAIDLLDERYAKGEIAKQEYEEKKADILKQ